MLLTVVNSQVMKSSIRRAVVARNDTQKNVPMLRLRTLALNGDEQGDTHAPYSTRQNTLRP